MSDIQIEISGQASATGPGGARYVWRGPCPWPQLPESGSWWRCCSMGDSRQLYHLYELNGLRLWFNLDERVRDDVTLAQHLREVHGFKRGPM